MVTHIIVRGDALLASDALFGVKASLVRDLTEQPVRTPTPDGRELGERTWARTRFDIVLPRSSSAA